MDHKALTYVLRGRAVVAEPDTRRWNDWMRAARSRDGLVVERTRMTPRLAVVTLFMGIDHNLVAPTDGGPPKVFETMVLRDGEIDDQRRYATWETAALGHREIVAALWGEAWF